MIKIWMSLGVVMQNIIVIVLMTLLCMMILAIVYRLVKYGVKLKASVGSASVEIDASEENEEEEPPNE